MKHLGHTHNHLKPLVGAARRPLLGSMGYSNNTSVCPLGRSKMFSASGKCLAPQKGDGGSLGHTRIRDGMYFGRPEYMLSRWGLQIHPESLAATFKGKAVAMVSDSPRTADT